MQIVMAMYLLLCFITYAHKMILWDFWENNILVSSIGRCATLGYTAVGVCSGGVPMSRLFDACKMCRNDGDLISCEGINATAVVSVEGCPGGQLWTGSELLVTELRGAV